MKIILNNNSLYKALRPFNDVGFVPTMGSIHEGHISLIERSNRTCKKTIVSIFVNPKQFNNKKDFKSYPINIFFGFIKLVNLPITSSTPSKWPFLNLAHKILSLFAIFMFDFLLLL